MALTMMKPLPSAEGCEAAGLGTDVALREDRGRQCSDGIRGRPAILVRAVSDST